MKIVAGLIVLGFLGTQCVLAQESPSRLMAATMVSTTQPGASKGEGMLLNGLAAEWHTTADGQDFHYIKAAVDRYLAASAGEAKSLDDVEMGRSMLLVYRVTKKPEYYKAARSLYSHLASSDGHDAETFQAAYAATFHQRGDFDRIANQLLLMGEHRRNTKEPDSEHIVALVDALNWFPMDQPQRPEFVAALKRSIAELVKSQDAKTGLWAVSVNAGNGMAAENCMFVYAIAKGVRMGYLPQRYEANARRGWMAIQKKFVTAGADGKIALSSGGSDGRAVGAFLLAGSEMEQSATEALGQGKTALVDAWFNSQTRKNAAGQTELFHYKWTDDSNSGFSFFGRMFQRYGVKLAEEKTAPTAADLKKVQIYILPSPDIPSKNPNPHYMDAKSVDVIANWVKDGGVLLLMENDGPNAEFEHFDTLSDRFGIHFNQVLRNHVIGENYPAGTLMIPAGTGVFEHPHQAYMKDTCTISVKAPGKAVVTAQGDVMIAVAKYGKGTVFGVVDPWVYNEYIDRRNHLPVAYDNFDAAIELAGWAVKQSGHQAGIDKPSGF